MSWAVEPALHATAAVAGRIDVEPGRIGDRAVETTPSSDRYRRGVCIVAGRRAKRDEEGVMTGTFTRGPETPQQIRVRPRGP